jgi:putative ABC transport system permease protein
MRFHLPRRLRRLLAPFTWNARDREMDREMAFHLESLRQQYVRSGMPDAEATRAARARFGDVRRLKDRGHDVRTALMMDDLVRDVRHMARGLRKSPGFTIAVVLTLALGIGGNTAIFSVVDQLLLRPLPYPDGDALVMVYEALGVKPGQQITASRTHQSVSPANWMDWQARSRTLERLAAFRTASMTMTESGDPTRLAVQMVSSEFFPLLGVRPLLGRAIVVEDDLPNAPRVAVLSHRFWQGRLGGDPGVVGRRILLNDQPTEIIGVMPPGFAFIFPDNDLWSALQLDRTRPWRDVAGRFITVVARMRQDTSRRAAQTEMEGIASQLSAAYEFNKNTSVELVPLREELTGRVQTSLLVLFGAVGVLLSIACFNVANLLLARAAARRREIAIRTSLGAGRLAIVRQLVVESLLLSTAGGVLGVGLARWSLDALVAFAPPDLLRAPDLSVDVRVLLYTLALSTLTGLLVGIVPALLIARESTTASTGASGARVTHAPRIRQILVICQVAMTVMLLCGAGLLVRTLAALNAANTGVDMSNVLTMDVGLPAARYPPERRLQFYREALTALGALPGVESASAGNSLAVIGAPRGGTVFHRLGTPTVSLNDMPGTVVRVVASGYFRTLRIPVLRGREFADSDDANPTPGFVVNQAFVEQHLAGLDPLRERLQVVMQQENPYLPIIGVVANVSEGSVRQAPQPTVFYSHRQMPETGMTLLVRASQPLALAGSAVQAIRRLDPNLAVTRVRTFELALGESLARERMIAFVSGTFALSGLLLASLGLYALLAFLVAERTKEIGIRIALGAQIGRLTRSVVARGLRLAAIGAVVGVAASLVLLRSLRTLLFGVTPNDATTYAAVLVLLCAVAALASYVPARWAARVEPLTALRHD